jgi:hypothetical protein
MADIYQEIIEVKRMRYMLPCLLISAEGSTPREIWIIACDQTKTPGWLAKESISDLR